MIRFLARLPRLLDIRRARRQRREREYSASYIAIVFSAPARPPKPVPVVAHAPNDSEAARMTLLRRRFSKHEIPPGWDRPLRLHELTQLMRHVTAEHREETHHAES